MQYPKTLSQQFLQLTEDLNMKQVVTFPTRKDATLGLFLTNCPSLVSRCKPLTGLGDHEIVLVISEISTKRQKPVKRKIHLWKKADLDAMKMRLLYLIYSSMPGFPPRALLRRCGDLTNQNCLKLWTRLFHRKLPPRPRDTTNLGLQERLSVSADESSELTVTRMPKGQVVNKIGRGTRS